MLMIHIFPVTLGSTDVIKLFGSRGEHLYSLLKMK